MRLAFSKPTSTTEQFETLMTGFRSEGYDGLQLKTGQFLPFLDDVDGYLGRWGDDTGRVSALVFFDTLEPEAVERLEKAVELSAQAGGERVVFCQNESRAGVDDDQRRAWARQLSDIGLRARDRGVALSLHHHFDQPIMLPEDVTVFFEAVAPGAVGLTVDTAHLAKSGIADIPAFLREFADVIDNIHLKDFSDGEWRLLGQGGLDLTGILAALADIGYDGWLCVDEESSADLLTGLRESRRWLADYFETPLNSPLT